jgi:hypothetical protein
MCRLVGLVTPLGWLGINFHGFMASIHKRPTGLCPRFDPTGSERLDGQLCKAFRKECGISLRRVLELMVVILSVLRKVCVARWVGCSIRDKRSREVEILLEWRWRQRSDAETSVLVFGRFKHSRETAVSKFIALQGSDSSRR